MQFGRIQSNVAESEPIVNVAQVALNFPGLLGGCKSLPLAYSH